MANQIFKGFKQVTFEQFSGLTDEQKLGYLWFVRSNISGDTYEGDIYFSSKHYGHFGGEVEALEAKIDGILKEAGVVDSEGKAVNIPALIEAAKTTAGIATEISGTSVDVKVADDTENAVDNVATSKNYVKVNGNNELEVKGVDIDSAVVAKDIQIAGGQWAESVKKVYTSGILPSGTTLQSFFQAMLCVEMWGTPSNPSYKFSASVSAPTANMNKSGDVPVGTIATVSASAGSMSASNSASVSGYNYGYSLNGSAQTSTNSSYNATVTAPTQDGAVTIACSVENLRAVDDVDGSRGASKQYYVLLGTGKYNVNETGKTVTRGTVTDQDVYNVSNLKNVRSTDKKSITNTGFIGATDATITPTNQASKTVNGYYPVYFGTSTKVNTTQSDITESVLKAFGDSHKSNPTTCAMPTGTGTYICAVPSNNAAYTKSSIVLKDSKGMKFGASNTFTMDVTMLNNVATVNYRVFFITNAGATTDASSWTITFE